MPDITIPNDIRLKMYNFIQNYDYTSFEEYMISRICAAYLTISNKEIMLDELKKDKNLDRILELISN